MKAVIVRELNVHRDHIAPLHQKRNAFIPLYRLPVIST